MSLKASMKENQHYYQRYVRLIKHYQELNLSKKSEVYTESHHIIPRSAGGDDSTYNLVRLPFKAHILAHWMLHKAYPEDAALASSFAATVNFKKKKGREDTRVSSRMFERAKVATSGKNSLMRRNGHTPEARAKISETSKLRVGEKSSMFGRLNRDMTIYSFVHPTLGEVVCTQYDFYTKHSVNRSHLSKVCRGIHQSHKQWQATCMIAKM